MKDELLALEEQGWAALATDGAGRAFYDGLLDGEVEMLLPGGMVLSGHDACLDAMSGPPWSSYRLEELRIVPLGEDAGLVAYGVVADRDGSEYSALVSSTYVRRRDGWRLVFHQQTPR